MPEEPREKLRGLEPFLRTRLKGQDHILPLAAAAFHRGELGLVSPGRPRGSFVLVGPTGTGKTELMLLCADFLFGPEHLVRFDLSEFARDDAVALFLGTDANDAGALGRAMRGRTQGIVLFDELEKAHWRLWDLFLQLLDPGHVRLTNGDLISVAGFYVAFCSNIGGAEAMRMEQSRFASVEQMTLRQLTQTVRPELVGRIEEKWVFARLNADVQREICALRVADETARLRVLGYELEVSREAMEFFVREGFHPHLGARPLRQTIERSIRDAVAREIFARGTCCGRLGFDTVAGHLTVEAA